MTRLRDDFDVQAHRGGAGLVVENTLEAFDHALALGVTTLELDVHLTADLVPVVSHDPHLPGVAEPIGALTAAEVRAVDVGSLRRDELPTARSVPGAPPPLLSEVFDLCEQRGAHEVRFNIEAKFDALAPETGASREVFIEVLLAATNPRHDRVTLQCFDWSLLAGMRAAAPEAHLSILFSPRYLASRDTTPSPWLGDFAVDHTAPDPVALAARCGFDQLSPIHGSPYRACIQSPDYRPHATRALVDAAHERGLTVVPYVVDDHATMRHLIDLGCDGLITNYPDRLRAVLSDLGERLPRPVG